MHNWVETHIIIKKERKKIKGEDSKVDALLRRVKSTSYKSPTKWWCVDFESAK